MGGGVARWALGTALVWGLASCGEEPFRVESCSVQAGEEVALNQAIVLEFSRELEPRSAVSFSVPGRQLGTLPRKSGILVRQLPDGPAVRGRVEVRGRTLIFRPSHPRRPDGSDGGLQPGQRYRLLISGPPSFRCLRSRQGRLLDAAFRVEFVTAPAPDGNWTRALIDADPGRGPRLLAAEHPAAGDFALLLRFSEALNPQALAQAGFRLHPPPGTPQELWDATVPRLKATLVENEREALLGLRLTRELPFAVRVDPRLWVDFDSAKVQDFDGNPLPAEVVGSQNPQLRWPPPAPTTQETSE